ncbi:hypothetical protein [Atlantibacter subterraneus]|uniref:hypothetical protein n=1 Tax=Atlantibacter subterraneus TaxID=255519 RepID=UPI000F67E40D|nr:hypothetical protein [Atlantibacter subterranea]MDA3131171.1 hypothetical protein [Atlantibacter subterranea]
MNQASHESSSLRIKFGCVRTLLTALLISSCTLFCQDVLASNTANENTPGSIATDSKAVFERAVDDYFSGRYGEAKKAFGQLYETDYADASAVPAAVNLAAMGKYTSSLKAFGRIKKSTNVREKQYAQLWELWLTAKQWRGSNKELNKKLERLVSSQDWQPSYMQSIAKLYVGQETIENVFNSVSTQGSDETLRKDALTEATFFAGGYLQNVKHDNAAALRLFNDNLNKLNSVSLERPFIDRECASLNKLAPQSK